MKVFSLFLLVFLDRMKNPGVFWEVGLVAGLFLTQVLIGAIMVWMDFSLLVKSIHLSVATLVWASLVYLAVQMFLSSCLHWRVE